MATQKRGHTSRPAKYLLAEKGNMDQSPSLIVNQCRLATVMPCLATIEQDLPNHQRKPPCHSEANRCNSEVIRFDRRTYTQRSSLTEVHKITPSSANSRTVLSAPQGAVTYLQLCKPIIPRVRANSSGVRSHKPYIHKSKDEDTLEHNNLNTGLVVNGVQLGQVQPHSENVQRGVKKVQFHVYLPTM